MVLSLVLVLNYGYKMLLRSGVWKNITQIADAFVNSLKLAPYDCKRNVIRFINVLEISFCRWYDITYSRHVLEEMVKF